VGYPIDTSLAEIKAQADLYGVWDQLEVHQGLGQQEVNLLFNRAKVNLLWSRREGVNRTIVEGMFAGTPCIVRSGFNYGFQYPLINGRTGTFATEHSLPSVLLDMVGRHSEYSPREWVLEQMSCLRTTAGLNEVIRTTAVSCGEEWTTDLVPKVNTLNGVEYWAETDAARFAPDIEFIRSCMVS
jgi:hypothetical protein